MFPALLVQPIKAFCVIIKALFVVTKGRQGCIKALYYKGLSFFFFVTEPQNAPTAIKTACIKRRMPGHSPFYIHALTLPYCSTASSFRFVPAIAAWPLSLQNHVRIRLLIEIISI